jgi:DNA-directed RNA polymerase subunit L
MELKKIKKKTKEIEIEIIGETETILNPITELLLENKDVDYATYMSDNPESNKRKLYIRVKRGKPEEILIKAVKKLENEYKTFDKIFKDKSKSKK